MSALLALAFGVALAAGAPVPPLAEGVSCNTSKRAIPAELQVPDAPEFEAPVVLVRSEAVAPAGREADEVKVLLRVVVCTDGIPRTPTIVISGTKEFDAAAADAVLRWRFAPGKRFGVPAAMSYTTLVRFGPVESPPPPPPVSEPSPPSS